MKNKNVLLSTTIKVNAFIPVYSFSNGRIFKFLNRFPSSNYLVVLFALFTVSTLITRHANATSYTWNGATSSAWNTGSNWTPNGTPGSGDAVTITSSGTNRPLLSGNVTINGMSITGGTFNLNGDTLLLNSGASSFSGGTISNGLLKMRGTTYTFSGATLTVPIDAVVSGVVLNGGTFNNYCSFETNTNVPGSGTGGCTFNDSVYFYHNYASSGIWRFNTSTGNTFNGKVKLKNISTAEMTFGGAGINVFNGDIVIENTAGGGIFFGNDTLKSGHTITIGNAGYSAGEFRATNFYQEGSTAQNLTFTGTALPTIEGATFNGAFTLTANILLFKNCTFNSTAAFTDAGSSSSSWSGGNKFYGNVTITNNASAGNLRVDADTANTYYANATFTGSRDLRVTYGADVSSFYGDITTSSNVKFDQGSGTLCLAGSGSQSLNFNSSTLIKNLKLNKSGGSATLAVGLTVVGAITFVKGNLTTSSSYLLNLNNGGTVTGASDSSFIDGPIKKIGNSVFVFPIGKGISYRSIEISAPSVSTDAFSAEYFDSQQTLGDSTDTTLTLLSTCNYWYFQRNAGTSNVYATFSWDNFLCGVYDTTTVRIGKWNGTLWSGLAKGTLTSSGMQGSLKTPASISSFGYFAIANGGSAGAFYSGVVCGDGKVNVWGDNSFYQHGDCTGSSNAPTTTYFNATTSPQTAFCTAPINLTNIKAISSGYNHVLGLTCDNKVVAWGSNSNFKIGNGTFNYTDNIRAAVPVMYLGNQLSNIKAVAAGLFASMALTEDGHVLVWGQQDLSSTQINSSMGSPSPTFVQYSGGGLLSNVIAIAAGSYHFLALLNDGTVVAWGNNNQGQFGIGVPGNGGGTIDGRFPYTVLTAAATPLTNIKAIAAGSFHNLALDEIGRVYAWGLNTDGQLGIENAIGISTFAIPTHTTYQVPAQLSNVSSIAAGGTLSGAIVGGQLHTWGLPGQNPFPTPASISINNFYSLSIGYEHYLGFTLDNHIYGYNRNSHEQIETGSTFNYGSPQDITANTCALNVPCDHNITYCIYDYQVSSTEVWSTTSSPSCYSTNSNTIFIENEILIPMGAQLIVTGIQLAFGPNGRIVLEQGNGTTTGGKLVLNAGSLLTAAGDCMWKGIEVRGSSTHASTDSWQAHVTLNGGIVEHAHNAITLGNWDLGYYNPCGDPAIQGTSITTGGGGIITVSSGGATFRHNAYDVRFLPYGFTSSSIINNGVRFEGGLLRDGRYLTGSTATPTPFYAAANPNQRTSSAIYSWLNRGININGNSFNDIETPLWVSDSKLYIRNNNLTHGKIGIYISNLISSPYYNNLVSGNSFDEFTIQLYDQAGRWDNISPSSPDGPNEFGDASTGIQANNTFGIYLTATRSFYIHDNSFSRLTNGVCALNTGFWGGEISYRNGGNTFNDCATAIKIIGTGMGAPDNARLIVRCNNFFSPTSGLYSGNSWNVTGNFATQGHYTTGNTVADEKYPAGNRWQTPGTNKLNGQFTYIRHFHTPDNTVDIDPILTTEIEIPNRGFTSEINACGKLSPTTGPSFKLAIDSIQVGIDTLQSMLSAVKTHVNGEYTLGLVYDIVNETNAATLMATLRAASPLSDGALSELHLNTTSLSDDSLTEIFRLNGTLSRSIIDEIVTYAHLSSAVQDSIFSWQGIDVYKSVAGLDMAIGQRATDKQQLVNDLGQYYLENDSLGELIKYLRTDYSVDFMQTLFAAYLAENMLDSAQVMWNRLDTTDVDPDWLYVQDVLLQLALDSLDIYSIDSAQHADLFTIAAKSEASLATANARTILRHVFGEEFVDADIAAYARKGQELQQTAKVKPSQQFIFKLIPNPATESVTVYYSLPTNAGNTYLSLYNIAGKQLQTIMLKATGYRIDLSLNSLSNGLYMVCVNGNNINTHQKLVINK